MPRKYAHSPSLDFLLIDIGEAVRKSGLSVSEVAKGAGISPRTLYYMINGETAPELGAVVLVLDYLGLKLTISKNGQ